MRERFPFIATLILVGLGPLQGQDAGKLLYQVLGPSIFDTTVLDEGFGAKVVRGKPFSATEERHSLQILGDGTRIETTQKNRLFRDSQGRTRVEEMNGTASIFDPVAGFRAEIDPAAKTARKGGFVALNRLFLRTQPAPGSTKGVMSETTENLKPQLVNGVMAQGVRTTMVIPKGQIGNDRDIKVVTERWVSNDLQMLIKSTNSDPRFGETTYQLTGIDQREPDASLFQIPASYTVVNDGLGRGRSPVSLPLRGGRSPAPAPRQLLDEPGDLLKDK
ncbi:MAG TPA: hypothetical protein VH639_02555 [Bryobacteraceae bacterium]|jgi:hypothetical protein